MLLAAQAACNPSRHGAESISLSTRNDRWDRCRKPVGYA